MIRHKQPAFAHFQLKESLRMHSKIQQPNSQVNIPESQDGNLAAILQCVVLTDCRIRARQEELLKFEIHHQEFCSARFWLQQLSVLAPDPKFFVRYDLDSKI